MNKLSFVIIGLVVIGALAIVAFYAMQPSDVNHPIQEGIGNMQNIMFERNTTRITTTIDYYNASRKILQLDTIGTIFVDGDFNCMGYECISVNGSMVVDCYPHYRFLQSKQGNMTNLTCIVG